MTFGERHCHERSVETSGLLEDASQVFGGICKASFCLMDRNAELIYRAVLRKVVLQMNVCARGQCRRPGIESIVGNSGCGCLIETQGISA